MNPSNTHQTEILTGKTIPTGQGKHLKDWNPSDLRNELKRFGEDVSENHDRNDMIKRIENHQSKFTKAPELTTPMGKTVRTGAGKDYSDWSVSDLTNELKRFGEDVSENVEKTELVQRVKNYYNSK